MRKLSINSSGVEIQVNGWSTYVNNKNLDELIREHVQEGTFHARLTLIIEEIKPLEIESNKPSEPEPQSEENTEN